MAVNVPEIQLVHDSDMVAAQKVTVYFDAATTSNTRILAPSTLKGANASRVCVVDIERIRYHTSFASGYLSVDFEGTSNVKAVTLGGNDGGELDLFIPNNAAAKTGNINLSIVNAGANDCATLLITYRKNNANGAFNNVYESVAVAGANGFPSAY